MATKRASDSLFFSQKTYRPKLSGDEAEYWKEILRRILKVSTEHEINLPGSKKFGKCGSHGDVCPCVNAEEGCYKDCANAHTCLTTRTPVFCKTRSTGNFLGQPFTCPAKNDLDRKSCQKCPAWLLNCRGTNCAEFTPFCTICPSFKRTCDNAVENSTFGTDEKAMRDEITKELKPSRFVGDPGESGALEVKQDGSLLTNGGVEIPTVGRRVYWNTYYDQSKKILEAVSKRGGYVNDRCGQHYHILAGYLTQDKGERRIEVSDLEKPLPEIIGSNVHQIFRRYELALFWMMSAGKSQDKLTRWSKFRQPIFGYSAVSSRLSEVIQSMGSHIDKNGKYASTNWHYSRFSPDGGITTFHIENRIADAVMSPAITSAWAMLLYAMVLKAVDFSQYGILEVGDKEFTRKAAEAYAALVNGADRPYGDDRAARTQEAVKHYHFYRKLSNDLINLLRGELSRPGMGPAYKILKKLAEKPVSLRLCEGDSWDKIEKDMMLEEDAEENPNLVREIMEITDTLMVSGCATLEQWVDRVSKELEEPKEKVQESVARILEKNRVRWADDVGSLIVL